MDEMTKEELLSAYLDGEVTAEQRAYVEKLIESDAEARTALEELRALSDSLKALPRMEVGEDLSERVLRRAERAILQQKPDETIAPAAASAASTEPSEKISTAETVAQKSDDTLVQPSSSAGASSGIGWGRRLAGPLAAIAAAILIMVMSQNKEEADLAQAPRSDVYTAPELHSNEESEELAHRDEAFESDTNHAYKSAADGEGSNGTARYRTPGEPGAPSMSAMRSPAKGASQELLADRKAGSAEDPDLDGIADKLAKSDRSRGKLNEMRTKSQARIAEQTDDFSESGQPTSGGRNRGFTAQVPADGSDLGAPGARRGAFDMTGKKDAGFLADDERGAEPQLVVDLVISSSAMQSGEFDQLLARQNIHFESPGRDLDQLAAISQTKRKNQTADQQELVDAAPVSPAAELAQSKTGENSKAAVADNDKKRNSQEEVAISGIQKGLHGDDQQLQNKPGSESNESVELVYVVASASQVQAALQEMQQQSQNYLAYSIEPQKMALGDYAPGRAEQQGGEFKREAEHEGVKLGKQSTLTEEKKSIESQTEKMPRQSAPAEAGNLDSNTRPSATLEAETTSPAKPSAGAQPAPAPPQDRALDVRGQALNSEGVITDSQSGANANRAAQQLPAGRAQRVQIPAGELSRWRENSAWYFSAEDDAFPAQELAANERSQRMGRNDIRPGKGGGGQAPAGEETQSVTTSPDEVRPDRGKAPSATPPAPELSKEDNKEREPKPKNAPLAQPTPAQEPALLGAAEPSAPKTAEPPAPKDAESPTRETINSFNQTKTFEQGEKSASAVEDAPVQYWQAGDMPAGLREDDLVRVLFVVRGARIKQPNVSQGQTGAAAAEEAAETEQSAPAESAPRNNDAPRDNSPAPNASPAEEE